MSNNELLASIEARLWPSDDAIVVLRGGDVRRLIALARDGGGTSVEDVDDLKVQRVRNMTESMRRRAATDEQRSIVEALDHVLNAFTNGDAK